MNSTILHRIAACTIFVAALCSCSGSKEPSALVAESQRISEELKTLADNSPAFMSGASASYADGTIDIDIEFIDSMVHVSALSEPLVQYVLAQYMKSHAGKNLDVVVNTLNKEEGKMNIKLSDVYQESKTYTVGAKRLVQLIKLKPMELNYNDVRTNVSDLLDAHCQSYATQYNAESCEFAIVGGFAQYTLTFAKPTAFAALKQATLAGRYVKVLQPMYENFGDCRPMVEELLQSLGIDGYRYVYIDAKKTKTLSAAIPWRLIK